MAITIGNRKLKKRHVKKAFLIAVYALVAITTVAGMSSGAFMGR
jgi:hypothetical protein